MLTPEQSNPSNNPNHPRIRCVDGTDADADQMVSADDESAAAPFRVFDILNQAHVGPEFQTRQAAEAHMVAIGGQWAPSQSAEEGGCTQGHGDGPHSRGEAERRRKGTIWMHVALNLSFNPNGTAAEDLKACVQAMMEKAVSEGGLTGELDAVVDSCRLSVYLMPAPGTRTLRLPNGGSWTHRF